MRVLLMANAEVGQRTLDWLLETYPDDMVGVVAASEDLIAQTARNAGKPVMIGTDSTEIDAWCEPLGTIDLGILAWWPKLVRSPVMERPRLGFINFHPSMLPYNRGKHYNFWALVEQAPFGVSLHFADDGVDTGDIVAQQAIEYDWTDNGGTLYRRAIDAIVQLFADTYPAIRTGHFDRRPQDLNQGSFHRASELEQASRIDLDAEYRCRDLLNRLRARTFSGHPACWFVDEGAKYEVRVEITKVEE